MLELGEGENKSASITHQLERKEQSIDVIAVGLGFMGFGFLSLVQKLPDIRVPLLISRRVGEASSFLRDQGFKVVVENDPRKIQDHASRGYVCVSDQLDLIQDYENDIVVTMTGTVAYESEVALKAINSGKHLVTMNAELQATVGTELKKLADRRGVIITDVLGDQPGSLARFIRHAKQMGFKPILAGNMKRYMNRHATQAMMKSWADEKGLSVRQVTSFTDGTKQSLELNLVADYFGMKVSKSGMIGPHVENIKNVLDAFDWESIHDDGGVVDYVIGRNLFPGIFIVAGHLDPRQENYLRYLSLGDGPRYVLFEPYHYCHLQIAETIGEVVSGKEIINNGLRPTTGTITVAKFDLERGTSLDGIGGDSVYGNIDNIDSANRYLPIGFAHGAVLKRKVLQDEPIELSDVILPVNSATKLAGLV